MGKESTFAPSTASAKILAAYRAYPVRDTPTAKDIVARATPYLDDDRAFGKLGNDGWALLEQLAQAALTLGNFEVADKCIARLDARFPASPRVDRLHGLALEARGDTAGAHTLYATLLRADAANVPVRKRRIALLRANGGITELRTALDELLVLVDTWYADAEAWLELADLYAECGLYPQSLSALSHVLLLNAHNPFYVLRAAETAYTLNDVPLALSFFLRAIEMMDEASSVAGAMTRGWYGVKLCARRVLQNPTSVSSPSETAVPSVKNLELLDELATERILAAYSSPAVREKGVISKNIGKEGRSSVPADVRGVVIRWLQGKR